MPEADLSPQHRCAAEVHLTSLKDDRFIERQAAMFVVFSEENAEQHCVAGNLHGHVPFFDARGRLITP